MAVHVGISGWTYAPWRGPFYPPGLPQSRELAFAARCFDSIEINGTFYSLQRPETFARWKSEVPQGFVFAIKAGRYITHLRRLREVEAPLANFFASGILGLGEALGPILWQLPPTLRFDPVALAAFLALLPPDTAAAARLAERHDDWMADRVLIPRGPPRPLRHALEVRHPSFADPALVRMLRRHGVALVVADTAGKWPQIEDVTADFCYLRLHGDEELYVSGYTDEALDRWADRVRAWAEGDEPADARKVLADPPPGHGPRDVWVYFDNDVKVRAPFDAEGLARRLGLAIGPGIGGLRAQAVSNRSFLAG